MHTTSNNKQEASKTLKLTDMVEHKATDKPTTAPSQMPTNPSLIELKAHEYANYFPGMGDNEFTMLKQDIAANRQREAIIICDGKILDGRNRYRALTELLAEGKIKQSDIKTVTLASGIDPLKYVLSANLHRRHLNESQRALVGARIIPSLRPEAEKHEKAGQKSTEKYHCNELAAKMVNVSTRSVAAAKHLLDKKLPELETLVNQGLLRVSFANILADLDASKLQQVITTANAKFAETAQARQQNDLKSLDKLIQKTTESTEKYERRLHDGVNALKTKYSAEKNSIAKITDKDQQKKKEDEITAKLNDLEHGVYPENLAQLHQTLAKLQTERHDLAQKKEHLQLQQAAYQNELKNEVQYSAFIRHAYSESKAESLQYVLVLAMKWVGDKFDTVFDVKSNKKTCLGYRLGTFASIRNGLDYLNSHKAELDQLKQNLSAELTRLNAQVTAITPVTAEPVPSR